MQIITAAIIKGGAGKSTTAAALAQAAAAEGKKVLLIDLDPQGNVTAFTGASPGGSYSLLEGAAPETVIQETDQGIDVIAASPDLATQKTRPGSAKRLQEALEPIRARYDYIFIDTPPQMGELTYNALQASTGLIIPLETDSGSLQGLYQIAEIAYHIQQSNPELSIIGTIITRYEGRTKINRYLRDTIADKGEAAGAPLLLEIRKGIAIREAQGLQISLYRYAPNSNPAKDYKRLFEEHIETRERKGRKKHGR